MRTAAELWQVEVRHVKDRVNKFKPGKEGQVTFAQAERLLRAILDHAKKRVCGTK